MNINNFLNPPKHNDLSIKRQVLSEKRALPKFPRDAFCKSVSMPNFTSTRSHKVVDDFTVNCNYTDVFRSDIDWGKFVGYLNKNYKNQNKVDIYCYGCSDGSEPYSLALKLADTLGFKKAQKFFPIKASDIDETQITNAKNGILYLTEKDVSKIKMNLNNLKFDEVFEKDTSKEVSIQRNTVFTPYIVKPKLRNLVTFEVANISQEAQNKNFKNSVVMFRNGWTFNDLAAQKALAKDLYDNMNDKSALLIGNSDMFKSNASEYLKEIGFKPLDNGIFTNVETDYPSNTIGQPLEAKTVVPKDAVFVKN